MVDMFDILNTANSGQQLMPAYDAARAMLSPSGKRNLLAVALATAPESVAADMVHMSDIASAGCPVPAFESYAVEARDWACFSPLTERECYLAAIWQTLPVARQEAFLDYAQRKVAA